MSDQQPPVPDEPVASQPPPTPPPGPVAPPYPYGQPPLQAPARTQAIWAMVLAIIPCLLTWIAAVVLAIIALSRRKDGQDHGRGFAIAALVIVGAWLVIGVVVAIIVGVFSGVERDSEGSVSSGGRVDVTDVKVGDCIVDDDIEGETSYTVTLVPCSESHLYEAYANFDLPDGDYPGDEKASSLSEDGCADRFESYVGTAYEESELGVTFLYPEKSSWSMDQGVTCLLTEDTKTTGSLKDAQR